MEVASGKGVLPLKNHIEKDGLKLSFQKSKIMVSVPITSQQTDGETVETIGDFIFLGSKITGGDCSHELKDACSLEEKLYDQPTQHIKKQRHYFANKDPSTQSYGFSSSHVWM